MRAFAAARPRFPETLRGTIRGHWRANDGQGTTQTATWHITHLVFRLGHVQSAFGATTAFYRVSGSVFYSERETGSCAHDISKTFHLPKDLSPDVRVPLALEVDPYGYRSILGTIIVRPKLTYTCRGDTHPRTVAVPSLFDVDVAGWSANRPLRHTVLEGATSRESLTLTFDLTPGR